MYDTALAVATWLKPFLPYIVACAGVSFIATVYGKRLNDIDAPQRFDKLSMELRSARERKFPQDMIKDFVRGMLFLLVAVPLLLLGATLFSVIFFFDAVFH